MVHIVICILVPRVLLEHGSRLHGGLDVLLVMVVWVHAHTLGTTHPPVAPVTAMDRRATRGRHAPVRRHIPWTRGWLGDQAAVTAVTLVVTLVLVMVGGMVLLVVRVGR